MIINKAYDKAVVFGINVEPKPFIYGNRSNRLIISRGLVFHPHGLYDLGSPPETRNGITISDNICYTTLPKWYDAPGWYRLIKLLRRYTRRT